MDEKLREILDEKFYHNLSNLEKTNRKALIAFAGVPYSGRNSAAVEIASKLNGIYVNKDLARTIVYENEKIENTQQPEDILDVYMPTVFERLTKVPNGLIVLDASVDRKASEYKKWTEEKGYQLIIIGVEVDRETAEDTIKKERDAKTAKWFIDQYDRWYADHEKFLSENKPDFTIKDIENEVSDLIEKLEELIK